MDVYKSLEGDKQHIHCISDSNITMYACVEVQWSSGLIARWTFNLEVGGSSLVSVILRQEALLHIVSLHPGV